jgi:hypothetical protein
MRKQLLDPVDRVRCDAHLARRFLVPQPSWLTVLSQDCPPPKNAREPAILSPQCRIIRPRRSIPAPERLAHTSLASALDLSDVTDQSHHWIRAIFS